MDLRVVSLIGINLKIKLIKDEIEFLFIVAEM